MLKKPEKYIEIDMSDLKLGITSCLSYCVLFEPTLEEVTAINNASKNTMIFIFTEKEQEDWVDLPKSDYIVRPFRVAGLTTHQVYALAQDIITSFIHRV